MDDLTKIALIVLGLPFFVQDKIDPAEISSVSKLMSKLNSFDRPRSTSDRSKSSSSSVSNSSSNAFSSLKDKELCAYCLTKGKSLRHLESNCRNKLYDTQRNSQSNVPKKVNNVESTQLINEILEQQKNE